MAAVFAFHNGHRRFAGNSFKLKPHRMFFGRCWCVFETRLAFVAQLSFLNQSQCSQFAKWCCLLRGAGQMFHTPGINGLEFAYDVCDAANHSHSLVVRMQCDFLWFVQIGVPTKRVALCLSVCSRAL